MADGRAEPTNLYAVLFRIMDGKLAETVNAILDTDFSDIGATERDIIATLALVLAHNSGLAIANNANRNGTANDMNDVVRPIMACATRVSLAARTKLEQKRFSFDFNDWLGTDG